MEALAVVAEDQVGEVATEESEEDNAVGLVRRLENEWTVIPGHSMWLYDAFTDV